MYRKNLRTNKLKPGEIIPLSFDPVFTGILNNEDNVIILENILSIYFNKPLDYYKNNIKIKSRNLPTENKKEHDKQVDLVIDRNGEKTNIELNSRSSEGIINRNVVYVASIHGKQLQYKDTNYSKINNTVQINFNNFRCNDNKIVDSYYLRNENGKVLTKKFRIDYVDLVKVREKEYNNSNEKLVKILKLLNTTKLDNFKKEIDGIMEKEAENKLIDQIEKYSSDDEVYALYSAYSREELERNTLIHEAKEKALKEGHQEGFQQGLEQGLEQGINETKLETARKMLEDNIDIKLISKYTDLNIDKIKDIK